MPPWPARNSSRSTPGGEGQTRRDLPASLGEVLVAHGHDVDTVVAENLAGHPDPDVAVRWRAAHDNGDFDTQWDLEAPELHASAGRQVAVAALKRDYQPPTPDHQIVSVNAVRTVDDTTDQKDKYVFVYLDAKPRDYPVHHEIVTLRKVDGAWRVAKWQP